MTELYNDIASKYGDIDSPRLLHFNMGRYYFDDGDFDKALEELQRVASFERTSDHEPLQWEAQFLIGLCLAKQRGQEGLAIQAITEAAWASTDNKENIYGIAQTQLSRTSAYKLQSWATETVADKIDGLSGLDRIHTGILAGRIYLYSSSHQSDYSVLESAKSCFESVLEVDPKNAMAEEGISEIYRQLDQTELAVEHLRKAKSFATEEPERIKAIGFKLVEQLIELGQFQEASVELELLESQDVLNSYDSLRLNIASTTINYFDGILAESKLESAIADLSKLIDQSRTEKVREQRPVLVKALQLLARLYIAQGQFEKAIATINEASQLDRSNQASTLIKAQALLEGGSNIEEGQSLLSFIGEALEDFIPIIDLEIEKARSENPKTIAFKGYLLSALASNSKDWTNFEKFLENESERIYKPAYHLLKANLYLGRDSGNKDFPREAVISLFKSGRSFNEHNEHDAACFCFAGGYDALEDPEYYRSLLKVDSEIRYFDFEYANALLLTANRPVYPYQDKSLLETAARIWDRSRENKFDSLESNEYWYLEVMAFIKEVSGLYEDGLEQVKPPHGVRPHGKRLEFNGYWQSLFYGSKALLLNRGFHSLSCLARFFRNLDFLHSSKLVSGIAYQIDDTYDFAVEESLLAVLNNADFPAAEKLIGTLDNLTESSDYTARYLAYKDYHEKNYEPTLQFFEELLAKEPDNIWALSMKIATLNRMLKFDETDSCSRQMLEFAKNEIYRKEYFFIGKAYYFLGNYEEAEKLFNESLAEENRISVRVDLFHNALACGQVDEAAKLLDYVLSWNLNARVAIEMLEDLATLQKRLLDSRTLERLIISDEELEACLSDSGMAWRKKINEHLAFIRESASPELELTNELKRLNLTKGSAAWLALKTGLCIVYKEQGLFENALEVYEQLDGFGNELPELGSYKQEIARQAASVLASSSLEELGSNQNISNWLALDHSSDVSRAFSDELLSKIHSPAHFWQVDLQLSSMLKTPSKSLTTISNNVKFLRSNLSAYWSTLMDKGENVHQMQLEPITIWLEASLIPSETGNEWIMIKEYLPKLRADFRDVYGIELPFINLNRAQYSNEGDFAISVNEIARIYDTVPADIQTMDESHDDRRSSMEFIANKLKIVLLNRLSDFITVDVAEKHKNDALSEWQQIELDEPSHENDRISVAQKLFKNIEALSSYTIMLSYLLREGVPITDKVKILTSFVDTYVPGIDPSTLLRKARLAIRDSLSVNRLDLNKIYLTPELEEKMRGDLEYQGSKIFLTMKPEDCQEYLEALREQLSGNELFRSALVLKNSDIRLAMFYVVGLEFGGLAVNTSEELTSQE